VHLAVRRREQTIAIVGVSSALVFGLVAASGHSAPPTDAAVTLTATGSVQAPQQLALSFATPGRLSAIEVRAGEAVEAGTVLARIDSGPALAALRTAAANLASARGQLLQLRAGLSPAERGQLRVSLQQSQQALRAARTARVDAEASAAQDATRLSTALDQANAALSTDQAKLTADGASLVGDQTAASTAAARVVEDRSQLASDEAALLAAQKQQTDDEAAEAPAATLAADTTTILTVQAAVAADQAQLSDDTGAAADARNTVASDASRVAADQTAVASDRNAVAVATNAQAAGGTTERQSLDTARAAVASSRLDVAATRAANAVHAQPPSVGTRVAARAAVHVAEAALATAEETLRETRLVAPFAGTIAAVDGVPGQLVGGGESGGVVTLVNLSRLTVAASFDAADAALLAPGQPATVTVDALGDAHLAGRVVSVDPLPDPVPANAPPGTPASYTATVELVDAPAGLRPGMDAALAVTATASLRSG